MVLDHRLVAPEVEHLLRICRPRVHIRSTHPVQALKPFQDEREIVVSVREDGLPAQSEHVLYHFSSGSTGQPKIIGRTADSLLAEVERFSRIEHMPGRGDRVLLLSSLHHSFGLIAGFLHATHVGAHLIFPRKLSSRDLLAVAAEQRVEAIFGVPAHFDLLSRIDDPPALPCLRLAVSTGEALPGEVFARFEQRYGVRIGQAYGMTEIGIIATDLVGVCPPPSVGRPAPGLETEVRDGELYVRLDSSPYLHAPESQQWSGGWLRTFDLAELDPATSRLAIKGRSDSMVVIGGLNVDLTEVEAVLRTHDRVAEAVVVFGDVIEAHVATIGGLDESELASWCQQRLSGHKIPRRFHFVPDLPRTVNGKLVRNSARLHAAYHRQRGMQSRSLT
jgi:acyl-coenzyme A synthetase/AMP-(fatty) acid ligase